MDQFITSVNAPPSLDFSTNVATNWTLWKEQWENYTIVVQLEEKPDALQKAIFLNTIGPDVFWIYKTLEVPTRADPNKLDTVPQMFDDYATQYMNVTYERYVFNTRTQQPDETVETYIRQVKHLANTCNFPSVVRDELLRDRIICGIRDNSLRKRLLREKKLTLSKTIDLCGGEEATERHMKGIAGESPDNPMEVNAVKRHAAGPRPKFVKNAATKHQSTRGQRSQPHSQPDKTCLFCG